MEIRKTTLLSFLVCIAGILAEIMFRDVLAKSAFGVALSVALALVIIILAYFFYDGFYSFLTAEREMDKRRQGGYDQNLYTILNEQIQIEKAIYNEVHALLEKSESAGDSDGTSLEALEECLKRLETLQAAVEGQEASGEMQGNVHRQGRLEQMQRDIEAIIESESELKQNQGEIQESIRKLAEIMGVLLSLLRRKKPDTEKADN